MSTAHGKQPAELTPEQQEEQKQKERFIDPIEQETESTFSQLFTFAAAIGWGKIKGDRDKFELFQAISNPHLHEILLDLSNPQNINDAKVLFKTVKDEFDQQNFDTKTKTYKKTTASRGSLWGRATISIDTLTKADQQIAVGERFHSLINSHETNTRIDQAVSIYGIGNKDEFTNNLSKWMKENPGSDFDGALHAVATRQLTLEQTGKEDEQLTEEQNDKIKSSQKKLIQKELKEEARQKAIEYGNSIKPDAEGVMTKINTSGTGLNPNQFQTELNAIGKPVQEPVPPPPSPAPVTLETLSAPPAPHPEMDELYGEMMGESPTVIVPPGSPSLKGAVNAINSPTSGVMEGASHTMKPGGISSRFGKLSNFLGKLNPENLLKGGLSKLAAGLGIKKGLLAAGSALLGIGSGGISLAAQAGLALLNHFLHLDKVLGYSAKAIGIVLLIIIGAPILVFVLGNFQQIGELYPPTPSNLAVSNPSNLSWSTFETDYLQIAKKKEEKDISWNEFQKKYLTQNHSLLTDTNNLQTTTNN